jgi:hypothetical protein
MWGDLGRKLRARATLDPDFKALFERQWNLVDRHRRRRQHDYQ